MISSDLLFQVEPIYTFYSMSGWDIFLIVCIAWVIAIAFWVSAHLKSRPPLSIDRRDLHLPQIDENNFESKISTIIRQIIKPEHQYPDAYTAREIRRKNQHRLLSLLEFIEEQEYKWIQIDAWERKNILDRVRKEL